jgi:hypothetical protein
MKYDAFVRKVIQLARAKKIGYLVPGHNDLFVMWEKKLTPEQVVDVHCTKEAQTKRFNPD